MSKLPYSANDPRIGQLMRNGVLVYYAHIAGRMIEHTDPLEVAAHLWASDAQAMRVPLTDEDAEIVERSAHELRADLSRDADRRDASIMRFFMRYRPGMIARAYAERRA